MTMSQDPTRDPPVPSMGSSSPPPALTLWGLIRSDIRRKQEHYVLVQRFFNKYVKVLAQHGTAAVVVYRLGHWAVTRQSRLARVLAIAFYTCLAVPVRWISRVVIDPRVPIGPGFVIHNFSAVYIDAERIGDNFTVNQGVTVGPDFRRNGRPVIGSNVFLGAGAAILGSVEVGDNVVVAANALVVKPPGTNCLVAGVPGMILMRNLPPDYLTHVPAHHRG